MSKEAFWKTGRSSTLAVALLLGGAVHGHVLLLDPNGGEELLVGSVSTVRWQVTGGNYNPLNWDLWYSTDSETGPWLELDYNLPAGSGFNGSIHTYDWTIPPVIDDSVWVRVRMDNAGADYLDVSNGSFSIVLTVCPWDCDASDDGNVGMPDVVALIAQFDVQSPLNCTGGTCDYDGNGCVDVLDLLTLLAHYTSDPGGIGCPQGDHTALDIDYTLVPGIDFELGTSSFVIPNQILMGPPYTVQANVETGFGMQTFLHAGSVHFAGKTAGTRGTLATVANMSISFPYGAQLPVLNLPPGYTANSKSANIVNNVWMFDDCNVVGVEDLLALLAAWGTNPGGPPDFNDDGDVGVTDLLAVLGAWGVCPQ